MTDTPTIKLLNTNKKLPVTVYSFDGDSVTLPANQSEALPVDGKFSWNLPRGVKNMTPSVKKVEEEAPVLETPVTPVDNTPPQTLITPLS